MRRAVDAVRKKVAERGRLLQQSSHCSLMIFCLHIGDKEKLAAVPPAATWLSAKQHANVLLWPFKNP